MKLTVLTFLTLDGVMQAPGGPEEDPSEAFTHGGWQAPFPDPAVGDFVTELNSHASAFLFGRRTFGIFRGYWPDQTDPANPIATAINSLPKYVVSGSLSQADARWRGEHPDTARLVTGDVVAAVQALKDEPGDELQIWGSSKLLQTLLRHELVDRFRLMTFPLVLGSGRRLFNDGILPATMRPAGLTVTDLKACLEIGDSERAARLLRQEPDLDRRLVAHVYLGFGRPLEAGNIFAAAGLPREAAKAYETSGDWPLADRAGGLQVSTSGPRLHTGALDGRGMRHAASRWPGQPLLAASCLSDAGDHAAAADLYLKGGQPMTAAASLLATGDQAGAARILVTLQDGDAD